MSLPSLRICDSNNSKEAAITTQQRGTPESCPPQSPPPPLSPAHSLMRRVQPHHLKPSRVTKGEVSSEKQETQGSSSVPLQVKYSCSQHTAQSHHPQIPMEMWLPAREPHMLSGRRPHTQNKLPKSPGATDFLGPPTAHPPRSPLLTAGAHGPGDQPHRGGDLGKCRPSRG